MAEGSFKETEDQFRRVIKRFTQAIGRTRITLENGDSEEAMERITRLLMLGVKFNLEAVNDDLIEIPFVEAYQLGLIPTGVQLTEEERAKRYNELIERGASYQQINQVMEKRFKNVEHDYAFIQAFLGKNNHRVNGNRE